VWDGGRQGGVVCENRHRMHDAEYTRVHAWARVRQKVEEGTKEQARVKAEVSLGQSPRGEG
jgi:hypothetical protein